MIFNDKDGDASRVIRRERHHPGCALLLVYKDPLPLPPAPFSSAYHNICNTSKATRFHIHHLLSSLLAILHKILLTHQPSPNLLQSISTMPTATEVPHTTTSSLKSRWSLSDEEYCRIKEDYGSCGVTATEVEELALSWDRSTHPTAIRFVDFTEYPEDVAYPVAARYDLVYADVDGGSKNHMAQTRRQGAEVYEEMPDNVKSSRAKVKAYLRQTLQEEFDRWPLPRIRQDTPQDVISERRTSFVEHELAWNLGSKDSGAGVSNVERMFPYLLDLTTPKEKQDTLNALVQPCAKNPRPVLMIVATTDDLQAEVAPMTTGYKVAYDIGKNEMMVRKLLSEPGCAPFHQSWYKGNDLDASFKTRFVGTPGTLVSEFIEGDGNFESSTPMMVRGFTLVLQKIITKFVAKHLESFQRMEPGLLKNVTKEKLSEIQCSWDKLLKEVPFPNKSKKGALDDYSLAGHIQRQLYGYAGDATPITAKQASLYALQEFQLAADEQETVARMIYQLAVKEGDHETAQTVLATWTAVEIGLSAHSNM